MHLVSPRGIGVVDADSISDQLALESSRGLNINNNNKILLCLWAWLQVDGMFQAYSPKLRVQIKNHYGSQHELWMADKKPEVSYTSGLQLMELHGRLCNLEEVWPCWKECVSQSSWSCLTSCSLSLSPLPPLHVWKCDQPASWLCCMWSCRPCHYGF